MNKADLLTATFRQLAAAKTLARVGASNATIAKEGKEKAEHFRDQFRLVAQAAKSVPKPDVEAGKTDAPQVTAETAGGAEGAEIAEVSELLKTEPKERVDKPSKKSPEQSAVATTPLPVEWRGPEAALSAVISKLEQAQSKSAPDDDGATAVARLETRVEPRETALKPADLDGSLKAGEAAEPRFTLAVDSAETRTMPPIKVAVREQETHFEPVQQPTLLQKIVDRMVSDLPAAPTQARPAPTEVALPDLHKSADSPVKILTIQLEPPDLGAVTVKMRLSGDAVEIRLSAESRETTQLLKSERTALTDIMQSAGYKFDITSIDQSRSSEANAGAGQQQPQPDQRPSQQSNGGSPINDANPGRQSSDTQAGTRQNRQQHDQVTERVQRHQDKEPVRDRNGGALYL